MFPAAVGGWQPKLKEMVPSLGVKLSDNPALFEQMWDWSTKSLELDVASDPASTAPVEVAAV